MKYKTERPSIGISTKCGLYERDEFEKLCKKYHVTMAQGQLLLIRFAVDKQALPIRYFYEKPEYLKKEPLPENGELIDIIRFIRLVEEGSITEEDGTAYISDGENILFNAALDVLWLSDRSHNYHYVCWVAK